MPADIEPNNTIKDARNSGLLSGQSGSTKSIISGSVNGKDDKIDYFS